MQKREILEEVMERYSLEESQETQNLLEKDLEKNPCDGNKFRYYLSQIDYHNKLIEKTIKRLNECDKKFDFSLKDVRNNFSIIWNYKQHRELKKIIEGEFEEYSNKLESYKKRYEELFRLKGINSNL